MYIISYNIICIHIYIYIALAWPEISLASILFSRAKAGPGSTKRDRMSGPAMWLWIQCEHFSNVNTSRKRQVPANAKCQKFFQNSLICMICITYHAGQISLGQYTSVGTERRWARVIANGSSNTMMSLVSRRIEIFNGNAVLSTPKIKATKRLGLLDTVTSASDVPQALPWVPAPWKLKFVESVFILFCVWIYSLN